MALSTETYRNSIAYSVWYVSVGLGLLFTVPVIYFFNFYGRFGFTLSIPIGIGVFVFFFLVWYILLTVLLKRGDSVIMNSSNFDLHNMRLGNLYEHLTKSLNKRVPRTIFFKNRDNEIIHLDIERQRVLREQISILREVSEEWKQLRADDIFTNEYISVLADDKLNNAKAELQLNVKKYKTAMEALDIVTRIARAEAQSIETENNIAELRAKADANFINAKTSTQQAKAEVIRDILNKDGVLAEMSSNTKAYVISSVLNPEGAQFEDLEMKEILAEQERVEKDIKEQKLRQETSQANVTEASANVSVKDLKDELDEKD